MAVHYSREKLFALAVHGSVEHCSQFAAYCAANLGKDLHISFANPVSKAEIESIAAPQLGDFSMAGYMRLIDVTVEDGKEIAASTEETPESVGNAFKSHCMILDDITGAANYMAERFGETPSFAESIKKAIEPVAQPEREPIPVDPDATADGGESSDQGGLAS